MKQSTEVRQTQIKRAVQKDFIGSLRTIANSNIEPEERLEKFISQTARYLVDNRGITMLLFSEALHTSDAELKSDLQQIFNCQKNLIRKIFLDGIAIGKWDDSIPVENLAMLYHGVFCFA